MYINYLEIGRRIAKRRKKLMLTQVEVERRADLSPRYLSNIERGKSIPSIDVLIRVADVLRMTPDEVLIGVDHGSGAAEQAAELMKYMPKAQQEQALNFILWLKDQGK